MNSRTTFAINNSDRLFVFLVVQSALILFSSSVYSQVCGGTDVPCQVCNITATITNVEGGEVVEGVSNVNGNLDAGEVGVGSTLEINALDCGLIEIDVQIEFDWNQGTNTNWIHGISFDASPNWFGQEGVIIPNNPGWVFVDEITGVCSGNNYGAGYYWDPVGDDCPPSGNHSNYNGSICQQHTKLCEGDEPHLVDGDPSDNWGIDCTTNCPVFGFKLLYCPVTLASSMEEITFFITEDGESGGWYGGDGCVFEITIPIQFHADDIEIPEEFGPICIGECIEINVAEGCNNHLWSTGDTTSTITVCPLETTTYTLTTFSDSGCETTGETTVLVGGCCSDAGEISATPVSACPDEIIVIETFNYSDLEVYGQQILIADNSGQIIEVFEGDWVEFTSETCEVFTVYNYHYLIAGSATAAVVGMNISDIDCGTACCDLVSLTIAFEIPVPPVFTLPPENITIQCPDELPVMEDLLWVDGCDEQGIAEPTESGSIDDCSGGTLTRTWVAEDICGNITEHIQTITMDPVPSIEFINPPANETVSCSEATVNGVDLEYTNSLTGDCSEEGTVSPTIDSDYDLCGGTITYTWETIDGCGNEIIHEQIITVEPAEGPEFISPPSDYTVSCENIPGTVATILFTNSESGDCLIEENVVAEVNEDYDLCGGTIIYTWTGTSPCGEIIIHEQVVTIEPAPEAQFIDPPGNITLNCSEIPTIAPSLEYTNGLSGFCAIEGTVDAAVDGSADLCGGTITYTWEFTDACGRTTQHIQTITVEPVDEAQFIDPPGNLTIDCSEIPASAPSLEYTNGLDGDCAIEGTVDAVVDGTADLCGGTITYTWEFTDACGRTTQHIQTITVEPVDEAQFIDPPGNLTIDCSEIPASAPSLEYTNGLDGDCAIEGTVDAVVDGSADLCGGTITYTWEFTDDCGRTTQHIQTITVEPVDEAQFIDPPGNLTIDCSEIPASAPSLEYTNGLDGNCAIEGTVEAIVDGTADLCGGTITYTWEFTDDCGRTTQHIQTITVEAVDEAQFIDPPDNLTLDCSEIPASAPSLEYTNGLDGDCAIEGTVEATVDGSADLCGGTITYTWEFTDDCGRTTQHVQVITVEAVDEAQFIDPPGDLTLDCSEIPAAAPSLEYTNGLDGDCAIEGTVDAVVDGSADLCGGTITYTWEFTDACGRTTQHVQVITVEPAQEAQFIDPPVDITVDCNDLPGDPLDLEYTNGLSGDCEISGFVSPTTEGEMDICGGDIVYTWTFTDTCGNEITHTQTIEIEPLPQAEFVDPPEDLITDCSDLPGDPAELFYTNGLDGDCEIEGTVAPDIVGEVDICGSEVNYTWTYTDQCDREIEYTQTITVEPITAAEFIDPPENISVNCEEFSGETEDLEYTNGLTGDCEISGSVSPEVEGEFDLCGGEIIYTWSNEDFCGNELFHTQVVTIEPAPPVEFVDPPADTVITCGNLPQDPPELFYSNGLSGECEISGYAAPETEGEIDDCGSEIVYSWTFVGPCGTEIIHVQQIAIEPVPEAEFTELPPDLNISCGEPIEEVLAIGYTNNQGGDCAIEGTVIAERTGSIDQCGGSLVDVWTFIDDCGREISHSRTITVEPVQEANFNDPPEDIVLSCSEATDVPVTLYYTNGLSGDCLIEGEVEADISGRVETCGNVLTYSWTFTDDCDRTITHTQTITQEPAVEAVFIDPPEDTSVDCADLIIDPPALTFRNSESTSECLIEGSVEAEVFENYNHCGGEVLFIWEFEDECGRTLQHQQTITVNPVPEAVFIDPPADLVVNCDEVPAFDIPLAYSNNLDGVCEISGEILPEVIGDYNSCGGEVVLQYTFTDDCGRSIEHQQQITILPPVLPEFLDPFEQANVSCEEALDLFENPPVLEYSNHFSGECAINGSASAESDGFWDECGGEIVLTWSEVICGELLEYVHTVSVEPAPSAEFTDPPAVLILDCGESEPDPFPLHYDNFSDNICHIEGSVEPVLEYSGNEVIYTWSFTDICGETVEYIWSVEVIPAPDIIVDPEFVFLCEGDSFDLGTVEVTDLNNTGPVITFHSDYPANAGNQLNNMIISPTENTSIYVLAVNDDDCESAAVFTFQVDEFNSAGNDGEDRLCFGEYDQVDLFSYLGNNYDQGGQWVDVNNSDVNLSDPSDVDFTGITQGIYQFYYLFGPVGGCEGDTSVVSIELLPEIEIITENIQCSADNESYQVSIHSPGLEITTNAGDLMAEGDDYYTVSQIDTGVNLIITASITGTTCTQDFEIAAPNCDCPPVPAPESNGDYTLCPEDDIPTLMVSLANDSLIANWYDSPTGGNLLAEDTLSYMPGISGTGTYRFYVESQSIYFPDCNSFSRNPIVIEILSSPTANNASLESCDHNGDGFGEFHLDEAIPQVSSNPNNTFSFHESEADALSGEAPLSSPYVNSIPQMQIIFVRVVNTNGCVSTAELELIVLPALEIEVESQSPTCINDEDGQATIEVSGPFSGYEYSLNQVDWFDENVFTNLSSGLYTVYIMDEEGCTGQSEFEIAPGLDIEIGTLEAVCNDAGTSENPDDDFYEISFTIENNRGNSGGFEVDLAGTQYGPYDYGISYTIELPADGMVYLIVFTDTETGCSVEQELGPLNTCSSDCLIGISFLNYICRDNGTLSDPTDDFYVVDLETEIFNPGMDESFVVTVNGIPIDTANYGTAIQFTLAADDSQPQIEVFDLNSPNCSASEVLDSLLSCSNECAINIELQSVVCDNQGTEEDLSDDTYTAWVMVSGFNTAMDWYIQGDSSEVFNYNEEVEIGGWLISDGPVTITVVDSENPNCTVEITIEPPSPCSEPCFIEATQIEIGPCDDFGTGVDPSDDIFSVSFVIDSLSGNNTEYTVSWESESRGPFEYGELTHIDSLPITGDTLELLIQDVSNENCFLMIPVYQDPCSFDCQLTTGQVTFQCDDNGTPTDPEDDFYEFVLIPEVLNPGQDSAFIIMVDGQIIDTIEYGNDAIFTIPADGSQSMVEIVDLNNPDCSDSFQTEPLDPCSDQCLIDLMLNSLHCDHQGTEEDLLDDSFTALVTANDLNNSSDSWYVEGEPAITYPYGEQVELGEWLIVDGPISLTIIDSEDPNCTAELSIDPPPPCSEPCFIELVEIIIGQCNDSDTGTDPEDDFFGVTFTIDSLEGMASQYHVNWDGMTWGPFEYGQQANIDSLPASGDTLVLHIIDVTNSQCQLSFEVSQQPCSFDCLISIGEVNSQCNDNGTPTDPNDDFYEFSIIPEVLHPGQDSAFVLTIDGQLIDTFEYKNGGTFTLSADGSRASIEVFDLNNTDCIASFQSDSLDPCSDQCLIELVLNSVNCDHQGTDEDLLDDTFIAFVIATELNSSSDSWYVEGEPGTTYPYGEQVELGEWLIVDGPVTITIVDSEDPNCTAELMIDPPPPCSTPCEIEIDDIVIGECNDNNTGSNQDDDFFGLTFVVNDLDGNTSDFRVHWSGMSWGPYEYGQTVFIDSLPANDSNVILEVVDSQNSNCQITFTVSLESCSSCDQMVNAGNDKILTCENPSVVLNGSASESGEFNWTGPNGFTSNEKEPQVGRAGLYELTVVFEDLCEFTDLVEVTRDGDFPDISAGDDKELNCSLGEVILTGSVEGEIGNYKLEWFDADGNSMGFGTELQTSQPGNYTFVVTDLANGCVSNDVVEVRADPTSIENILINAVDPLCHDESNGFIEILHVEGGTPPVVFSFNGQPTDQHAFSNLSSGTFTLSAMDDNGCKFDTTLILTNPDPLSVDLGPNISLAQGEETFIEAISNLDPDSIQSIYWTIDGVPVCDPCDDLGIHFTGESEAVIEISIVDKNGCTASDRLQIFVIIERNVYIPNAFSPDEDGINDRFTIYGDEYVEEVEEMMIYNRWGAKVFEQRNFPPNDISYGWDGTFNSQKNNPGTFVYSLRIRFADGLIKSYSGDLILLR